MGLKYNLGNEKMHNQKNNEGNMAKNKLSKTRESSNLPFHSTSMSQGGKIQLKKWNQFENKNNKQIHGKKSHKTKELSIQIKTNQCI